MIAVAVEEQCGKALTTGEIKKMILQVFSEFATGRRSPKREQAQNFLTNCCQGE